VLLRLVRVQRGHPAIAMDVAFIVLALLLAWDAADGRGASQSGTKRNGRSSRAEKVDEPKLRWMGAATGLASAIAAR